MTHPKARNAPGCEARVSRVGKNEDTERDSSREKPEIRARAGPGRRRQGGTGEAGTGKRRRTRRPAPSAARIRQAFERGTYPYETRLSRRPYEAQKAKLQAELPKLQRWLGETGERIVMLFEGRDAAGKGGTIKRFTEQLNPRDRAKMASWPFGETINPPFGAAKRL